MSTQAKRHVRAALAAQKGAQSRWRPISFRAGARDKLAAMRAELEQIIDRLDAFRSERIPIPTLIADLEMLLDEINMDDDEWKSEYFDAWSDLESSYQLALDNQAVPPLMSDPVVADWIRTRRT